MRRTGVTSAVVEACVGSGVDLLICSVAVRRRWEIFTADSDFRAYAKVIPIQLSV